MPLRIVVLSPDTGGTQSVYDPYFQKFFSFHSTLGIFQCLLLFQAQFKSASKPGPVQAGVKRKNRSDSDKDDEDFKVSTVASQLAVGCRVTW